MKVFLITTFQKVLYTQVYCSINKTLIKKLALLNKNSLLKSQVQ